VSRRVGFALSLLPVLALACAFAITRDGVRVVPQGDGFVTTLSGRFEAFPLPDWVSRHLDGPYLSYLVEAEPGIELHVLEVGSGVPVLLLHGNPTSGLLYRKVAQALPTDRVRVIMPTLVGLGFSSKVPASDHTLENHVRWLDQVLDRLQLDELVFAGQDWGGPIGMGAMARSPERLAGVVVLNTFFEAVDTEGDLSPGHALAKRPVLGELVLENLVSLFENLPRNQGDPRSLSPEVLALYSRPLTESGNRKAPLAMMRMVPDGPDHRTTPGMREIEAYVRGLSIPAAIVWGEHDPILGGKLDAMKRAFPDAPVTLTHGGHFLQEEVPTEIADALMDVVGRLPDPPPDGDANRSGTARVASQAGGASTL